MALWGPRPFARCTLQSRCRLGERRSCGRLLRFVGVPSLTRADHRHFGIGASPNGSRENAPLPAHRWGELGASLIRCRFYFCGTTQRTRDFPRPRDSRCVSRSLRLLPHARPDFRRRANARPMARAVGNTGATLASGFCAPFCFRACAWQVARMGSRMHGPVSRWAGQVVIVARDRSCGRPSGSGLFSMSLSGCLGFLCVCGVVLVRW